MTRQRQIEIMAAELAKSEQMNLADCRRWIERGFAAVDSALQAARDEAYDRGAA